MMLNTHFVAHFYPISPHPFQNWPSVVNDWRPIVCHWRSVVRHWRPVANNCRAVVRPWWSVVNNCQPVVYDWRAVVRDWRPIVWSLPLNSIRPTPRSVSLSPSFKSPVHLPVKSHMQLFSPATQISPFRI
jgi:hypothetical protein